jgi:group II intron reverse transcriptase/maturase
VEEGEIAFMLTAPENIRTLQRKLYVKAKQEPSFRFYALYDKVCRADILSHAYNLVRANKGAAGIDGITFEAIEAKEDGISALLAELKEALASKTYAPNAVKRVMIPKDDGTERPLGIPTIRDRVAQMAAKLVIEPIFEADFCDTSYGFRPKRSAHDAIDDVAAALATGHTDVIDADLSKYFDTIPHSKLLTVVAERIADGAILHLIKLWLKAPVIEVGKDGKKRNVGGGKGSTKGTPQGGVISPLLANLYLHLVDRTWKKLNLTKRFGARIVRYADDFVILCKWGTGPAFEKVKHLISRLGLTLNEKKTRIVNAYEESFTFLGFELRMRKSVRTGKCYPHVQPSKKSVKKIKDRVTYLTERRMTLVPLVDLVRNLNGSLRGWTGYFHHQHCSATLSKVRHHVEERLRTHLRKRHKVRNRATGYVRFDNKTLYETYGLYKMPTTAGWTKAHALP